jgi:hypothetical protein
VLQHRRAPLVSGLSVGFFGVPCFFKRHHASRVSTARHQRSNDKLDELFELVAIDVASQLVALRLFLRLKLAEWTSRKQRAFLCFFEV